MAEDQNEATGGSSPLEKLRTAIGSRTSTSRVRELFGVFGDMWLALFSSDAPSRRMAFVFFLSIGVFALAIGLGYQRYLRLQDLKALTTTQGFEETSKNLGDFIQKQAEAAKQIYSTLSLGRFSVELKPMDSGETFQGAEIEIVLELDSKETRYLVEDNMARLRDQITSVLLPLDRDELMTIEGKKRLKKKIMDRINSWLPHGRAVELYFSDMVLT